MAARIALLFSSDDDSGIAFPISSSALSTKTPDGAPDAERRLLPPDGSGVAAVTPARCIAFAVASSACPSTRLNATGLFGTARERASCVGNAEPGHRV